MSVQGVGGKVAVAILSALSDEDIYNAFLAGDKNMFTRAGGVGQKLATRIITELKEKIVGKVDLNIPMAMPAVTESSVLGDVISALANLGYQKADILRIISSMKVDSDIEFDVLLKRVLSKLSSGV
jgi:Holliday junction DNA helicase RuvA